MLNFPIIFYILGADNARPTLIDAHWSWMQEKILTHQIHIIIIAIIKSCSVLQHRQFINTHFPPWYCVRSHVHAIYTYINIQRRVHNAMQDKQSKIVNHGVVIQIITQNALAARLINLRASTKIVLVSILMRYR